MRLVCPCCGGIFSAEAGTSDAHCRQVFRLLAELPTSVSKPVMHYLAMFRNPDPGSRGLRWDKVSRLLAEVSTLAREATIAWQAKPARPNRPEFWGRAMERMVEQPPRRLPLKSHGYLNAIAYEIANDADRADETRRNLAERDGTARRPKSPLPPPFEKGGTEGGFKEKHRPTDEQIAEIRRRIRKIGNV